MALKPLPPGPGSGTSIAPAGKLAAVAALLIWPALIAASSGETAPAEDPAPPGAAPAAPGQAPPPPEGEVQPFGRKDPLTIPAPLRGVYDKPFLANVWRRAYLGGYTEFEYHGFQDDVLGIPRGFRAHRTNLFAFAEVADTVRFAAEIEFENEEPGEDTEVKVEMAFVDWVIFEELTFRGGALLAPLGRLNLNHDGPAREITDRPLVSTFVIPTTLTDPGVGAHGTFHLGGWNLGYEAYATNGFNLLDRDGELAVPVTEIEALLREGRPSLGGDNNKDVASMGRVSVQGLGAIELGGSWHVGTYDERSDNLLTILAADLAVVKGPFAVEGEIARAGFERDAFARTAGVPDLFWGFYVQGSVSGMPAFLKQRIPHVFGRQGTVFTAVLRYDWVDLDGDRGEAIEPGLNFRPVADTVFKFSYRFGLKSLGIRGVPGREGMDDDGFVFSLSTYF